MHNPASFIGGYNQYNHWDGGGSIRRREPNDSMLIGGGRNYMVSGFGGITIPGAPANHQRRVRQRNSNSSNTTYKWFELEVTGSVCNLSNSLWNLTHLRRLNLHNNSLTCISGDIVHLQYLTVLDLSANKLRDIPPELGELLELRELKLNNNSIRHLPCELGRLFQLQTLGLSGNPLPSHLLGLCSEVNGAQKLVAQLQDKLPDTSTPLPERPWIPLGSPDKRIPTVQFMVMCYNVLCDKYCTRQLYGYCPSWALSWEYRKKKILEEMRRYSADIISLQEVETEQFHSYFLPELEQAGYSGVFSAKSRARTMSESERKHVDGCAVFFRKSKFRLVKDHLIEFNQVAIEAADGQHDMINRVMTKDNIGLAVLLETNDSNGVNGMPMGDGISGRQKLLVATCHVHWDPEYCDVKLIQTMMFMHKLQTIIKDAHKNGSVSQTNSGGSGGSDTANGSIDPSSIPLIFCGDLNSLPDSGVIEYLKSGSITVNHKDFKQIRYQDCLHKLSHVSSESSETYSHGFKLSPAYTTDLMPFTNYTYEFKGIIDYIFYSKERIRVLGVLGGIDGEWFEENRIAGCPHPKIPSDHLPLIGQFEIMMRSAYQQPEMSQQHSHHGNMVGTYTSHIGRR